MNALLFRPALPHESSRIWEIILQAKEQMRRENKCQWDEHYPTPQHIAKDIENGYAHVLCRNEKIIAPFDIKTDLKSCLHSIWKRSVIFICH